MDTALVNFNKPRMIFLDKESDETVVIPMSNSAKEVIHILLKLESGADERKAFKKKLRISLKNKTSANILISTQDLPAAKLSVEVQINITLREGATLNYYLIHGKSKNIQESFSHHASLDRESTFQAVSLAQSGISSMLEYEVDLNGELAQADIKGASILFGNSKSIQKVSVRHKAAHAKSRQFFKNILSGSAQSEFHSLVHVFADAEKSDSNQLNKNLLLSDSARAFTKPQLQIDNDDVSATHGATVGQLDANEIFYLKSRGLSEDSAKHLLIYGFAEEIIEGIEDEELKEEFEAMIRDGIEKVIQP